MSKATVLPSGPRFKDLTGQVFGRLTVLSYAGPVGRNRNSSWLASCECGSEKIFRGTALTRGTTKSCGCIVVEMMKLRRTTHGKAGGVIYRIWSGMIQRCTNLAHPSYERYGARGIAVCERWRKSFEAFLEDMGVRPAGKVSIERMENEGNYEPGNCVWSDDKWQARNKRNNILVEFDDVTLTLIEWAEILEIPYATLYRRLKVGWSVQKAFTTPKVNRGRGVNGGTMYTPNLSCLRPNQFTAAD